MEKFIPKEKLSKKKQRQLNARGRVGWGQIKPVTRVSKNPKAYNRQQARKWSDDSMSVPLFLSAHMRSVYSVRPYLTLMRSSFSGIGSAAIHRNSHVAAIPP